MENKKQKDGELIAKFVALAINEPLIQKLEGSILKEIKEKFEEYTKQYKTRERYETSRLDESYKKFEKLFNKVDVLFKQAQEPLLSLKLCGHTNWGKWKFSESKGLQIRSCVKCGYTQIIRCCFENDNADRHK